MKNNNTQEQFRSFERNGQLVLSLNSEIILPENAPVRRTNAQLEELDWKSMKESALTKSERTEIYYARAYAAWERGSNENLNGFIRYFIPKGTKLKDITTEEIKKLEEFINNYPRKILGGRSAENFHSSAA